MQGLLRRPRRRTPPCALRCSVSPCAAFLRSVRPLRRSSRPCRPQALAIDLDPAEVDPRDAAGVENVGELDSHRARRSLRSCRPQSCRADRARESPPTFASPRSAPPPASYRRQPCPQARCARSSRTTSPSKAGAGIGAGTDAHARGMQPAQAAELDVELSLSVRAPRPRRRRACDGLRRRKRLAHQVSSASVGGASGRFGSRKAPGRALNSATNSSSTSRSRMPCAKPSTPARSRSLPSAR